MHPLYQYNIYGNIDEVNQDREVVKNDIMKTLHLNLKRKYFDMILSGEKPEEYREVKEHYIPMFFEAKELFIYGIKTARGLFHFMNGAKGSRVKAGIAVMHHKDIVMKDYDTITFSNGYAKDRDQFIIEFKGVEIKEGNPDWGAEKETKYFVIQLGLIL